jgi:hypothetical protein
MFQEFPQQHKHTGSFLSVCPARGHHTGAKKGAYSRRLVQMEMQECQQQRLERDQLKREAIQKGMLENADE